MTSSIVLWRCMVAACISAVMMIDGIDAMECYNKYFSPKRFNCPREDDDKKEVFCCGRDEEQRCCDGHFEAHDLPEGFKVAIGLAVMSIVLIITIVCCCCCCQGCIMYKMMQRRREASSMPMQPRAPVPSTDAAGRPLYPVQQYTTAPDQTDYPPTQYNRPNEGAPLNANPDFTGDVYPPEQPLVNKPDQARSQQPFTYGPVA